MRDVALVAVVGAMTVLIRFLPFLIFGGRRQTPEFVSYLGRVLPYAIMGMLIVYCLKGISVVQAPFGLPELLGVAGVVVLYLWKKNTLVSIGLGTVFYMVLVQFVF